ncbi:hypothetical protein CPB84DRAFT_972050 [Gymnopilus junonius]|uniref:Uncharacterized protein n=1 Tax=Gymnopilus junonius TaxID=109634 RepID=A0A9P5N8S2_GYMJU|nr:hypothetical protein CPB84DRAFT_972050 [Gymnopilus junonius]
MYRTPPYSRMDVPISPQGTNLNDPEKGIELIQDDSWYIFKLNNQMAIDLYPALFYFDNCDLSIRECSSKSVYDVATLHVQIHCTNHQVDKTRLIHCSKPVNCSPLVMVEEVEFHTFSMFINLRRLKSDF